MLENIFFMIFCIYVFSWIVLIFKLKKETQMNYNIDKNRIIDTIFVIILSPILALIIAFD